MNARVRKIKLKNIKFYDLFRSHPNVALHIHMCVCVCVLPLYPRKARKNLIIDVVDGEKERWMQPSSIQIGRSRWCSAKRRWPGPWYMAPAENAFVSLLRLPRNWGQPPLKMRNPNNNTQLLLVRSWWAGSLPRTLLKCKTWIRAKLRFKQTLSVKRYFESLKRLRRARDGK